MGVINWILYNWFLGIFYENNLLYVPPTWPLKGLLMGLLINHWEILRCKILKVVKVFAHNPQGLKAKPTTTVTQLATRTPGTTAGLVNRRRFQIEIAEPEAPQRPNTTKQDKDS